MCLSSREAAVARTQRDQRERQHGQERVALHKTQRPREGVRERRRAFEKPPAGEHADGARASRTEGSENSGAREDQDPGQHEEQDGQLSELDAHVEAEQRPRGLCATEIAT